MPSRAEPGLFVGGAWRRNSDDGTREIENPADGSVLAVVDEATAGDASDAVAAARAAFDDSDWSRTDAHQRAGLLRRIADLLERDREPLARIETLDTGKTLRESRIDVDDTVSVFRYYAELVTTGEGVGDRGVRVDDPTVISRVVREPVGVCVLITPWNYPLLQLGWKIAPALGAGCTMVAKPSELTPLSTIALVRLIEEAGVPAGVVNLVLGAGAVVGTALIENPAVDLISFTGGAVTGARVGAAAAERATRVALELGGKNPHIVFADTDLDTAADAVLTGVFLHAGQVCSAGTRLIVEDSIADALVAELAERTGRIRLGPGVDPASRLGPLISAAHRERVEDYVALGLAEGAELVTGGRRPTDPALADGYYYRPTIFDRCHRGMRVVREETFGPILTVERFQHEHEAILLGNDTTYGLAAGVRTADVSRAERVAAALRHGTVWINDFGPYTPAAEWGGFKRSGIGRELGPSGLAEYQELKHIWWNTFPQPTRWFDATDPAPEVAGSASAAPAADSSR